MLSWKRKMTHAKEALNAIRAFQERVKTKDSAMFRAIEQALQVIRGAFHVYKADELCFSFNGGKDSTVLLHLLRAVAAERALDSWTRTEFNDMQHVYFHNEGEFDEVLEFLHNESNTYQMNLGFFPSFKEGIQQLVSEYSTRAIFVGTRYSDPNSGDQEYFSPTTTDWPAVMRVNPIIRWSYQEVWSFLRGCGFEYCKLYDHGYTSLGSVHDSYPNPHLRKDSDSETFQPAWKLQDASYERAGREGNQTRDYKFNGGPTSPPVRHRSRSRPGSEDEGTSAAVVVIGDEVLNGTVKDLNSPYAIQKFVEHGVDVKRVIILEDKIGEIAAEIQNSASGHDFVVSAGGVGPTHDDVTMRAIALAFDRKIERNEIMEAFLRGYAYHRSGVPDSDPPSLPLADLPEGISLVFPGCSTKEDEDQLKQLPQLWDEAPDKCAKLAQQYGFPTLVLENVFILPGVPSLFAKKIDQITKERFLDETLVSKADILVEAYETSLADILSSCQNKHDRVKVGSYPVDNGFFDNFKGSPQVRIIISGRNPNDVKKAFECIHNELKQLCDSGEKLCKILSFSEKID